MITADQLKDVIERADALNHYLNIDQKKVEFEEEQLRTQAPDFWDDPKLAEEQMKKVKSIEKWIKGYEQVRRLADELQLAFDYHKEELVTEEEVDADYNAAITAIPRIDEHVAPEGRPYGLCVKDKLWRRWYRESRLGTDAYAYVYALGRGAWP